MIFYFSESHPFYSLYFIVSVLLFINLLTCLCFAYSVQHFGRLQLFVLYCINTAAELLSLK